MLPKPNDSWGPATWLVVIVVVLIVLTGGVVCIVNPATLSYEQYLNLLWKTVLGGAGLGVARAMHAYATLPYQSNDPSYHADPRDTAGAHDHPEGH